MVPVDKWHALEPEERSKVVAEVAVDTVVVGVVVVAVEDTVVARVVAAEVEVDDEQQVKVDDVAEVPMARLVSLVVEGCSCL